MQRGNNPKAALLNKLPTTTKLFDNLAPSTNASSPIIPGEKERQSLFGGQINENFSRVRKTSFDFYDSNTQMNRPPAQSPPQKHKDYNRMKYYSKLRTNMIMHPSS